ncbi:alpha beta-hydrolase [Roridomyces roridus]|uniref:Alpha beta-hydrolase n=1 Tax=Roridomyces roridus TaxID=1738132 RepID=A0AAD7FN54_9AGAR|nr:alpha beta-hydrolase [Roridomyces roridus]
MNGISSPAYFLRRLVNVISTLGVSNHWRMALTKPSSWVPQWMLWNTTNLSPEPSASTRWPSAHLMQTPSPRRHSPPPPAQQPEPGSKLDTIHQLLIHPALYDPVRTPRYPLVLSHGLYGFDSRGLSSIRMHYWYNVQRILRKTVGAEVIVTSAPGTGSIVSRAEAMGRQLQIKAHGRGVNLLAHSMGGLDCRHLISHIKPAEYVPLSLLSISTPHRGSPFMDWCVDNIGIGKLKREELLSRSAAADRAIDEEAKSSTSFSLSSLPSSFTSLLLNIVDSPAYANLTTHFLNDVFNPQTPDDPFVKYFSVAGRSPGLSIWHPLWLPQMVLDGVEQRQGGGDWGNDGIVSVESAKWGEFLGIMEGCDHWEMRGSSGVELGMEFPSFPSIPIPSIPIPSIGGLGSLVGKKRSAAAAAESAPAAAAASASVNVAAQSAQGEPETKKQAEDADAMLKISTDKMSSVFDWLVEQAPRTSTSSKAAAASEGDAPQPKKEAKKGELASKADLERFYIALCRKLYDEGL